MIEVVIYNFPSCFHVFMDQTFAFRLAALSYAISSRKYFDNIKLHQY